MAALQVNGLGKSRHPRGRDAHYVRGEGRPGQRVRHGHHGDGQADVQKASEFRSVTCNRSR
jgi:hypothetical protein